MKSNVGTVDQFVRIALGFVLVFLAATGTIGAWGYAGLLVMLTGAFRFCPAYALLGLSSRPKPADRSGP